MQRKHNMIYTSYFEILELFPKTMVPISICITPPDGYSGPEYKHLAPKVEFFRKLKLNHDNDYYINEFSRLILNKIDANSVYADLIQIAKQYIGALPANAIRHKHFNIVLLCYEKPTEFCHRHLVAQWLRIMELIVLNLRYEYLNSFYMLWHKTD